MSPYFSFTTENLFFFYIYLVCISFHKRFQVAYSENTYNKNDDKLDSGQQLTHFYEYLKALKHFLNTNEFRNLKILSKIIINLIHISSAFNYFRPFRSGYRMSDNHTKKSNYLKLYIIWLSAIWKKAQPHLKYKSKLSWDTLFTPSYTQKSKFDNSQCCWDFGEIGTYIQCW